MRKQSPPALNTYAMTICAFFCVVIVLGAYIRIPLAPVPITLQLQTVLLGGMLLGKQFALISVLLYILAGLVGVPVFAHGAGIGYVLNPTFGFIMGFAPAAYLTGLLVQKTRRDTWFAYVVAGSVGTAVVYLIGVAYFILISHVYLQSQYKIAESVSGILLFMLPADLIMNLVLSVVAKRLRPQIQRLLKESTHTKKSKAEEESV